MSPELKMTLLKKEPVKKRAQSLTDTHKILFKLSFTRNSYKLIKPLAMDGINVYTILSKHLVLQSKTQDSVHRMFT